MAKTKSRLRAMAAAVCVFLVVIMFTAILGSLFAWITWDSWQYSEILGGSEISRAGLWPWLEVVVTIGVKILFCIEALFTLSTPVIGLLLAGAAYRECS
jgi:hypothetical protein